jgi:hypothetical protein
MSTPDQDIIEALAYAWNLYLLEYSRVQKPSDEDDTDDFRKAIHDAMRIVFAKKAMYNL